MAPLDVLTCFTATLFVFALMLFFSQKHPGHVCPHRPHCCAEHDALLPLSPSCALQGAFPNWATTVQHTTKTRPDIQPQQQTSPVASSSYRFASFLPSKLLPGTIQKGGEGALAPPDLPQIESIRSDSSEASNVPPLTPPDKVSTSSSKTMESGQENGNASTAAQELQLLKQRIESLERTILSLQAHQRLQDHRISSLENQRDDKPAYSTASSRPRQELSVPKTRKDQTQHSKLQSEAAAGASAVGSPSMPSVDALLFAQSADNASTPPTEHRSATVLVTSLDSLLDDEEHDGLDTPALTPSRTGGKRISSGEDTSSVQDLLIMDSPGNSKKGNIWDGKIHWAMDCLFENKIEEFEAVTNRENELLGSGPLADQWVFQYGLRYQPKPGETNVYRTVKIEELPLDVRMDQVLGQVCCGDVFSARLLNTKEITGYHTAIVIFLQQRQAENFARYAAKEGIFIGNTRLKVTVINTPTYPMTAKMETLVWKEGYTRCVALYNFRPELIEILQFVIQRSICNDYIECIEDGWNENEICLRFHSIKIAATAYDLLKGHPGFHECRINFVPDPCTRSPK
ncbi:hypothetical protein VTN77DRAFT_8116 [Rasamsonia byssochlamydoides]|uniref:uncharacterized protein n=1 Tax=Rasamsonia byssochlamydoides TaxID=89139 RepID=UPI003742DFEF